MKTWKIILIIAIVVSVIVGVQFTVQNFRVEGCSMEPNLHSGEYVLVSKASYWFGEPKRGDIVVYNSDNGKRVIHRVVALSGEWVEMKGGRVYIDKSEEPLNEPYAQGDKATYPLSFVKEGEYFIVGDNRTSGGTLKEMVPRGNIIGKAWLVIWPVSSWRWAPNYSNYSLGEVKWGWVGAGNCNEPQLGGIIGYELLPNLKGEGVSAYTTTVFGATGNSQR